MACVTNAMMRQTVENGVREAPGPEHRLGEVFKYKTVPELHPKGWEEVSKSICMEKATYTDTSSTLSK